MADREMKEYIIKMRPCMVFGHTQEIVRCKDCKFMYEDGQFMCGMREFCVNEDFFCADGERRESE